MNFRRGKNHEQPEINLIPFIDVLLVILIFLMVTTTYSKFFRIADYLACGQCRKIATAYAGIECVCRCQR